MSIYITYGIIFVILLALELCYFKVADKFNIIDKPNERSSHSTIVLRGGGIIFALSTLVWVGLQGTHGDWSVVADYCPFLLGLFLVAGMSFVDDIISLPDSVRLVGQFTAAALAFYQLGFFGAFNTDNMLSGIIVPALVVLLALIVYVGATNVINFMDGINGITGGYALAVLVSLALINGENEYFLRSLIAVVILSVLVFCIFNFREKGKAKCFAGDVGSVGIGFIMLFLIGSVIVKTQDITHLIFLLVYGMDGVLTICHRIMLHENLGEAHRKHAYQLMCNELKMSHVLVSSLYTGTQLVISLGFIYLCPDTVVAHWSYLIGAAVVLAVAYVAFKKKYYYLHEEYLASLKK